MQVLTGYCNLQRPKKPTSLAETSLCPHCSLENETSNHYVGNSKLYQDIRVKYFGITKTTVHNVVAKCNINKLATFLKEAIAATNELGPNEAYTTCRWTLPNDSSFTCTAAYQ